MKVQKVIRAQGEYAKIGEDIKDGDQIIIRDSGQIVSGDYGDRHVFKVLVKNGDKNLTLNQTSMNNMIDAYGENTEDWIDKTATAHVVKQMVANELKNICYLTGEGWVMTNDGKFVPARAAAGKDEIDPKDIPF